MTSLMLKMLRCICTHLSPLKLMGRIGVSYARKIAIWRMHYTQLESVNCVIYTQTDENGLR